MPKRSIIAALAVGGVCLAAASWGYDRHYFGAIWPETVQKEVVGTTLVTEDALIASERHFAMGEGFARWRYRVEGQNPALRHLCGTTDLPRCSFTKSRQIEEGVGLTVTFSEGILTVEEWWS